MVVIRQKTADKQVIIMIITIIGLILHAYLSITKEILGHKNKQVFID